MAEGGLGGLLPPVVLELIAKTDKLKEGLNEARTNVQEMAQKSGGSMEEFGKISSGILKVAAGTAIALGVATVHMADDFEKSHARLETAVKNVGQNFEEFSGKIDATNTKLEGYGFTNAETESALARLTQATHDTGKATEEMGLAADIARARGIDLQSATDLLVKVEAGRFTQLTKLGIATADQVKGFKDSADAVKFLGDAYGGAAAARADTFAGKMEALHAKVTDLGAQIGLVLIPVIENLVSGGLAAVQWLQNANEATGGWLGKIALLGAGLTGAVIGVSAMVNWITRFASMATNAASTIGTLTSSVATFIATNPELAAIAITLGAVAAAFVVTGNSADDAKLAVNDFAQQLISGTIQLTDVQKSEMDHLNSITDATKRNTEETKFLATAVAEYQNLLAASPQAAAIYMQTFVDAGFAANTFTDAQAASIKKQAEGQVAAKDYTDAVSAEADSLDGGAVSAKEAKAALDAYTASTKDGQQAVNDMTKALTDQYDSLSKNTIGMLAAQTAQAAANASLADYAKTTNDAKLSTDDHTKALNDMETQLIDTAVKTADASTANTTYGSTAEAAAGKAAVQKQYLEAVAGTLDAGSPLRQGLEAYIAQLDGIKSNINTTINVDTDEANRKINEWAANARAAAAGVTTAIVTSRVDPAGHGATGGYHSGLTELGENGRELLRYSDGSMELVGHTLRDLPSGTYVNDHAQTEKMLSPSAMAGIGAAMGGDASPISTVQGGGGGPGGPGGGGGSNVYYITLNAGMGTDPHQLSTVLVDALKRYDRGNGGVPIRATG